MQIKQIYEKYEIMPQLATHMLRVAGVGKLVADSWIDKCDTKLVTELCLLHDMGNIVKFGFSGKDESKFGKIENIEHWRKVKQGYVDQYGNDAHDATVGILNDAGLSRFVGYIDEEEKLYFSEAKEAELSKASVASIILMYADCRVIPSGVVSYRKRIDDLKARYGGVQSPTWYNWTFWFEEWIQKQVSIDLNKITEDSVKPVFDELHEYQI